MFMEDLFEGYHSQRSKPRHGVSYDEMSDLESKPRSSYEMVFDALSTMSREELRGRTVALATSYLAQGVTSDFAGEERPFPLDAVPRVIASADWAPLEAGIQQRVRALEAFLADIYGAQAAIRDQIIPARVITSSVHFLRAAHGVVAENQVRIQVSGIDLIKDEAGTWRVLKDNVRVPSGVSYVISNRRVMAQTLPELFVSMRVKPVGDYPFQLLQALRAAAPNGTVDPTIVVLTPGVFNSAYFEHTQLAPFTGCNAIDRIPQDLTDALHPVQGSIHVREDRVHDTERFFQVVTRRR